MATQQLTPDAQDAIRARAQKSRELPPLAVDKTTYLLRRPSDLRWREIIYTTGGERSQMERLIVFESVIGWSGPTVADIDPAPEPASSGELPLPCTPDMVELYLEDRHEHYEAISKTLMQVINQRWQERENAKKATAG